MTYNKSYHSCEVMIMRKIAAVLITLLLSSCHSLYNSPQPLPVPTAQAQEIDRAQSHGLPRLGIANVTVEGSPDDAGRALAAKANAAGARYYQILALFEKRGAGIWYGSAILYGPAGAATGAY
ncbi:biofilm peroxide resistance protein BsmA [Erwinia pyrifoliae]|uniref:Biofilm peroxide resistance protein BsmA n=1 Tax=Erwinia pyrifoliae TaxID=79967 RepID=A0ABY5X6J4_ERWPY|nr:biofilm peroxide resistance protein BsmA [Erwinia pyrifoliae]AUX73891.1 biofilm peroxide resistance protein BsmA [Erwinia pyrifoliae]MCA8875775.1 biofilm peroxide resistance protein BsmA [Erwinia pyrifoliae]MCT2387570.1 biofilm peroxide resistance protein BsmA [Erwinia pyrifoliae]MCU8585826.1 biofilm peroxide resistance protein BsmA [Erwinia pyrifoliae]UWS28872.1 biofilm peroxide resistance protein BsmA [Erwinia pyrifoliae]